MATCRSVVNNALRKLGRLAAGREPRTADQTDALAALQGLYGSWIAAGAFGRLEDVVPTGTIYTVRGNERIFRTSSDTLTVELPELVSDAGLDDYGRPTRGYYGTTVTISTQNGDTIVDVQPSQPISYVQPPRDGTAVIITDTVGEQTATWLYDGTVKRWQGVHLLQLDSQAPRSAADPEGLAATLALELGDTFGADVGPTTLRQAQRFQAAMTQRFGMRREPSMGVYF